MTLCILLCIKKRPVFTPFGRTLSRDGYPINRIFLFPQVIASISSIFALRLLPYWFPTLQLLSLFVSMLSGFNVFPFPSLTSLEPSAFEHLSGFFVGCESSLI